MKKSGFVETKIKKVEFIGDNIGRGEYSSKGLTPGKIYDVEFVFWKGYPDGSGSLCYIFTNDDGLLSPRATEKFKVVERED